MTWRTRHGGPACVRSLRSLSSTPVVLVLLAIPFIERTTQASEELVPKAEAALLCKIVVYDTAFFKRIKELKDVTIGIVYREGEVDSESKAADMTGALGRACGAAFGRSVAAVGIPYEGEAALRSRIQTGHISLLYVAPKLDDKLAEILRATRMARTPTITGMRAYARSGVVLAAFRRDGRARFLVHLKGMRAVGMNLPRSVLALGEVVR